MNQEINFQQVVSVIKKNGLTIGREYSSKTGWTTRAVDNNNTLALTLAGRVHTPAEAVRVNFNTAGYKHAEAKRAIELPILTAAIEANGWTIEQVGNTSVWIVKVGA